jgi:hypothetical protein
MTPPSDDPGITDEVLRLRERLARLAHAYSDLLVRWAESEKLVHHLECNEIARLRAERDGWKARWAAADRRRK